MRPGSKGWATDVCVPISRLADCILETRSDIEESKLTVPLVDMWVTVIFICFF